jgi:hypothetical protein
VLRGCVGGPGGIVTRRREGGVPGLARPGRPVRLRGQQGGTGRAGRRGGPDLRVAERPVVGQKVRADVPLRHVVVKEIDPLLVRILGREICGIGGRRAVSDPS